ncbi:unnamed protein product [Cochlearia groenlandica]
MDDNDSDHGSKTCCSCCFSFIFTAGLTSLFLWLSLRADKPKCTVEEFYVPALNKTSLNSKDNTTLTFMVRFANPNKDQGIYYDDVHLSLTNNNTFVANYTVPRFYQGHKKKAKKYGFARSLNNMTVLNAVFRVDLETRVRFKILFWKTKRHRIEVGADVEVNEVGVKAYKKGIKLKKSGSCKRLRNYFVTCFLLNLLVFFAI